MRALVGLTLIWIFYSAGCAPAKSQRNASTSATFIDQGQGKALDVETPKVPITVPPADLDVVCGEAKCPQQVGVLVFSSGAKNPDGSMPMTVCTAFLIASDMIMSNGHCDHTKDMSGVFVAQKSNGNKNASAISGLVYKRYSQAADGSEVRKADVAIFKLQTPITTMPALRLASGPQADFKKLTAFAIFIGDKANQFKVLARECLVHRHESIFPFALSEAPDILVSFGCKMIQGNSGAPMFAPGSDEVQSVHSATTDLVFSAELARKENRELLPHQKHHDSVSTNVRCLDYPGAKPISCTAGDLKEINKRWGAYQQFEASKLDQREFPGIEKLPVRFKVIRQLIKITSPILEFDLINLPKCRIQDAPLSSAPVVFEKVRLVPDEWAVLNVDAQPVNVVEMKLKSLGGISYVLTPEWPAAPENLLDPARDYRKLNPGPFRIDLPVCPR